MSRGDALELVAQAIRADALERARTRPPRFPRSAERDYERELVRMVRPIQVAIRELVAELRPDFAELARSDGQVIRLDAVGDALRKVRRHRDRSIKGTRVRVGKLRALARSIDGVNAIATSAQIGEALAIEPGAAAQGQATVRLPTGSRRVARTLDAWVGNNSKLVVDVPTKTWRQVESTVREGFKRGSRHEVIARRLVERGVVAESRARLIARDQINKLNGQLTEARQRDLGITRYTWRTAQDDRVRDEHLALEGTIWSWSDPSPEGHPGEPIQCRCFAQPIVSDLLEG